MATMQSLHDVFVHELRDLYSAERQLIKALPKMAKNAGNPQLADALTNHLRETEVQVGRIEEILKTLGVKSGGVKCKGMEGLIAEGKEMMQEDFEGELMDAALISAAQKVEHYEIATYGGLLQLAITMDLDEVADLLDKTLVEEEDTDALLTDIAENDINLMAEHEDNEYSWEAGIIYSTQGGEEEEEGEEEDSEENENEETETSSI